RWLLAAAMILLLLLPLAVWLLAPFLGFGEEEPPPVRPVSSPQPRKTPQGTPKEQPAAKAGPPGPWERLLRQDFPLKVTLVGGNADASGVVQLVKGDVLSFQVEAPCECYLGIWVMDEHGPNTQLFPNAYEPSHRLLAGVPRRIPGDHLEQDAPYPLPPVKYEMRATGSESSEYLLVVASARYWKPMEGQRAGPYVVLGSLEEQKRAAELLRGVVTVPSDGLEAYGHSLLAEEPLRGVILVPEVGAVAEVAIPIHVRPRE